MLHIKMQTMRILRYAFFYQALKQNIVITGSRCNPTLLLTYSGKHENNIMGLLALTHSKLSLLDKAAAVAG